MQELRIWQKAFNEAGSKFRVLPYNGIEYRLVGQDYLGRGIRMRGTPEWLTEQLKLWYQEVFSP